MLTKLRSRLTASYLAVTLLTIAFLGLAFFQIMRYSLVSSVETELQAQAEEMARDIAPSMNKGDVLPLERLITSMGRWSPSHVMVTRADGRVFFLNHEVEPFIREKISSSIVAPTLRNRSRNVALVNVGDGHTVLVGVPVVYQKRLIGVLVLIKDFQDIKRTGLDTLQVVVQAAMISGILTILISIFLAGRMTRSIKEIAAAVEDIAEGNLKRRITAPGRDEIGQLAENVNVMSERLEALVGTIRTQAANRRDLMANISHEFRTPITNIRGFAEALQDNLVTTEQEKMRYYRIIQQQAVQIERLTGDMLEFSKLESGAVEMRFQNFDMVGLVEKMRESLTITAQNHELSLSVNAAQPSLFVIGDQRMIEHVMTNLFTNAVSFTSPGGKVSVSLEPHGTEVWCRVTDSGVGIPKDKLAKVWERFYRRPRPRTEDYTGTGLGLPIVKQIIEAHGGRVWAESEEGTGSSFYFSLLMGQGSARQADLTCPEA